MRCLLSIPSTRETRIRRQSGFLKPAGTQIAEFGSAPARKTRNAYTVSHSRNSGLILRNLPQGVELLNRSGVFGSSPYIGLDSVIGTAWLPSNATTSTLQLTLAGLATSLGNTSLEIFTTGENTAPRFNHPYGIFECYGNAMDMCLHVRHGSVDRQIPERYRQVFNQIPANGGSFPTHGMYAPAGAKLSVEEKASNDQHVGCQLTELNRKAVALDSANARP